jgi:uncharacterized protein (TIGR04255 family)
MSKLTNAPLIEVIFELSWVVNTPQEYEKFRFLLGDVYTRLKSEYPLRIGLANFPIAGVEPPLELFSNKPLYQFRKSENEYPLYQLGPGLLSVNTVNNVYVWENFEKEILQVIDKFKDAYSPTDNAGFNTALKYIDFYPFDPQNNLYDFLKNNLHLEIKNNAYTNSPPNHFAFATGSKTNDGQFNYSVNEGVLNQKNGLLVETNLFTQVNSRNLDGIPKWLDHAHVFLSDVFKTMTKGEMYNSFL